MNKCAVNDVAMTRIQIQPTLEPYFIDEYELFRCEWRDVIFDEAWLQHISPQHLQFVTLIDKWNANV